MNSRIFADLGYSTPVYVEHKRNHRERAAVNNRYESQESAHLRLRLKLGLTALAIVILFGTCGYRWFEQWTWLQSLYMTVITISTVGFKEVADLSDAGRLFTIILIFSGIGTIALVGSSAFEWMIEQHASHWMRRKRMNKLVNSLSGHIIVCGYGRMGRYVVKELQPQQVDVAIIEKSPEICESVIDQGMLAIHGDASDESVLEAAGIRRASAVVAALNTDADNLYLTLTAHGMRPDLKIIVRAEEQASHSKFLRAGATKVISPYAIGADHIVQLLLRPRVVDFIELVTQQGALALNIDQAELDEDSPLCHKTLAESHARQSLGRMILAIRKKDGETVFDPSPDTMLEPGDVLVTVGRGK